MIEIKRSDLHRRKTGWSKSFIESKLPRPRALRTSRGMCYLYRLTDVQRAEASMGMVQLPTPGKRLRSSHINALMEDVANILAHVPMMVASGYRDFWGPEVYNEFLTTVKALFLLEVMQAIDPETLTFNRKLLDMKVAFSPMRALLTWARKEGYLWQGSGPPPIFVRPSALLLDLAGVPPERITEYRLNG